jgi:hypothetical protein
MTAPAGKVAALMYGVASRNVYVLYEQLECILSLLVQICTRWKRTGTVNAQELQAQQPPKIVPRIRQTITGEKIPWINEN